MSTRALALYNFRALIIYYHSAPPSSSPPDRNLKIMYAFLYPNLSLHLSVSPLPEYFVARAHALTSPPPPFSFSLSPTAGHKTHFRERIYAPRACALPSCARALPPLLSLSLLPRNSNPDSTNSKSHARAYDFL